MPNFEVLKNRLIDKRVIGIVRINISHLEFYKPREIDTRGLETLERVFRTTECRRYDPDNYIPVVITNEDLKKMLKVSKLSLPLLQAEYGQPKLIQAAENQRFLCLRGLHRITAARNVLPLDDQWWVVRLILIKSNDELEEFGSRWKNDYLHQIAHSAGEIYRNIRRIEKLASRTQISEDNSWMENLGNHLTKEEWMASLSPSKQVAVRQLRKHKYFTEALDSLLPFSGLWGGLLLGNIQRHLALRCAEEIAHYLHHIKAVWTNITLDMQELRQYVCQQTVEALQGRAPAVNTADADFVIDTMRNGILFPKLFDKGIRKRLTDNLLSVRCIIPSIRSLHENLKYLEVGAKLLRQLVLGDDFQHSLHYSLRNIWIKSDEAVIQLLEKELIVQTANCEESWDFTYKQLWIFVLREFAHLGGRSPRVELGKPVFSAEVYPDVKYRLAKLAHTQGFRSSTLRDIISKDPRKQALRSSIDQTLQINKDQMEIILDGILSQYPLKETPVLSKLSSTVPKNEIIDINRRWGVPYKNAYIRGRTEFFLTNIAADNSISETMASVTFNLKDFVIAFFGTTDSFELLSTTDTPVLDRLPSPIHDPIIRSPLHEPNAQSQRASPESLKSPVENLNRLSSNAQSRRVSPESLKSPIEDLNRLPSNDTVMQDVGTSIPDFNDTRGHNTSMEDASSAIREARIFPDSNNYPGPTAVKSKSQYNQQPVETIKESLSELWSPSTVVPEPRLLKQGDFREVVEVAHLNGRLDILVTCYRKACAAQSEQLSQWDRIEEGFKSIGSKPPLFATKHLRELQSIYSRHFRAVVGTLKKINEEIGVSITNTVGSKGFVQIFLQQEPQMETQEDWATIQKDPAFLQALSSELNLGYLLQRFRLCYTTLTPNFSHLNATTRDQNVIKAIKEVNRRISQINITIKQSLQFAQLKIDLSLPIGEPSGRSDKPPSFSNMRSSEESYPLPRQERQRSVVSINNLAPAMLELPNALPPHEEKLITTSESSKITGSKAVSYTLLNSLTTLESPSRVVAENTSNLLMDRESATSEGGNEIITYSFQKPDRKNSTAPQRARVRRARSISPDRMKPLHKVHRKRSTSPHERRRTIISFDELNSYEMKRADVMEDILESENSLEIYRPSVFHYNSPQEERRAVISVASSISIEQAEGSPGFNEDPSQIENTGNVILSTFDSPQEERRAVISLTSSISTRQVERSPSFEYLSGNTDMAEAGNVVPSDFDSLISMLEIPAPLNRQASFEDLSQTGNRNIVAEDFAPSVFDIPQAERRTAILLTSSISTRQAERSPSFADLSGNTDIAVAGKVLPSDFDSLISMLEIPAAKDSSHLSKPLPDLPISPIDTLSSADAENSRTAQSSANKEEDTLTFLEFNGMTVKNRLVLVKDFPKLMLQRSEWVMFVGSDKVAAKKGWQTLSKQKILTSLRKRPSMKYVLVNPNSIQRFQKDGWKIIRDARTRSSETPTQGALDPNISLLPCDEDASILQCETKYWKPLRAQDSLKICIFIYKSPTCRLRLVGEGDKLQQSLQQFAHGFQYRSCLFEKAFPCKIDKIVNSAEDFATWLIKEDQVARFEYERKANWDSLNSRILIQSTEPYLELGIEPDIQLDMQPNIEPDTELDVEPEADHQLRQSQIAFKQDNNPDNSQVFNWTLAGLKRPLSLEDKGPTIREHQTERKDLKRRAFQGSYIITKSEAETHQSRTQNNIIDGYSSKTTREQRGTQE